MGCGPLWSQLAELALPQARHNLSDRPRITSSQVSDRIQRQAASLDLTHPNDLGLKDHSIFHIQK